MDGDETDASNSAAPGPAKILLVDAEPRVTDRLRRQIEREGLEGLEASDLQTLREQLAYQPEVVFLDLELEQSSGLELIGEIRTRSPGSEIVVMTPFASIDSDVACAGVRDFVEKPLADPEEVVRATRRALERRRLRVAGEDGLARIVARSPKMKGVLGLIRDLSHNESNVLIEAESGTGKELVARAIHDTSPRRTGPFIPVDCGALPEGLVESELFGYEVGAFTGADRPAPGLFRSANGGTLFLDEIGEFPLPLQSKLLRAIQAREVRPLGTTSPVPIDVRIVAATNRDLTSEVREGRFRPDLFYRLRVVSIRLPALRERPEDIPLLAEYFVARAAKGSGRIKGIEADALEKLLSCRWEGNVRELENTLEAAVALARGPRIGVEDLCLGETCSPLAPAPEGIPLSLASYECACLEEALRRVDGDIRAAARLLGVGRSTLYRKLAKHGLKRPT
jgi:DNA-binding NtrC family response regulator